MKNKVVRYFFSCERDSTTTVLIIYQWNHFAVFESVFVRLSRWSSRDLTVKKRIQLNKVFVFIISTEKTKFFFIKSQQPTFDLCNIKKNFLLAFSYEIKKGRKKKRKKSCARKIISSETQKQHNLWFHICASSHLSDRKALKDKENDAVATWGWVCNFNGELAEDWGDTINLSATESKNNGWAWNWNQMLLTSDKFRQRRNRDTAEHILLMFCILFFVPCPANDY